MARRAWTAEEKRSILAEVASGKGVAEVAKQWQVNTSTIYYWQKSLPSPPGNIAARTKARPKQSRLALAPPAPDEVEKGPTYIAPVTHPRGLSYEQLVDENARLRAALQALLFSTPR